MAGFKTFTAATLTASDVNGYLMRQTVIQATSTTRPSSPHTGMLIYETDTYRFASYDSTGWTYTGWNKLNGSISLSLSSPVFSGPTSSLANATSTVVIWQNESYDYAAMHGASSAGVNPYQDGKYAVTVKLAFSTTWTATSDYIQIESINLGVIAVIPAHTATGVMYAAAPIVDMVVGDTLQVKVFQNSGSGKTLSSGLFQMHYLGI